MMQDHQEIPANPTFDIHLPNQQQSTEEEPERPKVSFWDSFIFQAANPL